MDNIIKIILIMLLIILFSFTVNNNIFKTGSKNIKKTNSNEHIKKTDNGEDIKKIKKIGYGEDIKNIKNNEFNIFDLTDGAGYTGGIDQSDINNLEDSYNKMCKIYYKYKCMMDIDINDTALYDLVTNFRTEITQAYNDINKPVIKDATAKNLQTEFLKFVNSQKITDNINEKNSNIRKSKFDAYETNITAVIVAYNKCVANFVLDSMKTELEKIHNAQDFNKYTYDFTDLNTLIANFS